MSEILFDASRFEKAEEDPEAAKALLAERYSDWKPEYTPYNVQAHEIVVNQDRITQVLDTLMDTYENNGFPYNQEGVRLPHDPRHMPPRLERGSKDHAMFLWTSCYYMRGGEKSVSAFVKLSKMYEEFPELFDCDVASGLDQEDVLEGLKYARLGAHKTVPRQWIDNAKRMQQRYEGDPRNIFEGRQTFEDVLGAVQNDGKGAGFVGFQEKMTSMIMYYLMDEELVDYFNFPIPVDMHVTRVFIANKLVEFPGLPHKTNLYSQDTLDTIRQISVDYTEQRGVSALSLCNAVWLLSESLCGKYPGNVTFEPLGRDNRNGRSTVLIPQQVDITDRSQQQAYVNSCLNCPIGEDYCEYAIPGKPTYVTGSLYIEDFRIKFPLAKQDSLFDD